LTTDIAKHIFRFILLILLQVLIIQNIYLGSYIIVYPYILAILLLPFEISKILLLFIAFTTGVCVDLFNDSSGLHASACTLMAFARYYVLKFVAPRDGYDAGVQPNVEDMGLPWFITYAGLLTLVHHFCFFYLEIFRFSEFFRTFARSALSAIGTFALVYLLQYLFYTKRSRV
jgi:hypothetical protein